MPERPAAFWKVYAVTKGQFGTNEVPLNGQITLWDHNMVIMAINCLCEKRQYDTARDLAKLLVKIGGPEVDVNGR